jgi:cytochrome c oxidase cbb3-type subunit 3
MAGPRFAHAIGRRGARALFAEGAPDPLLRAVIIVLVATLTLTAQQPPLPTASANQAAPAGQTQPTPPGGRGGRGVVTSPRNAYPDRPPADPAAVERGQALYSVNCAFCHGADTRGGDSGPSLLRSSTVLDDQHGELIAPIVQNGRTDRGMPKFALTMDQIADLAAFIHSFRAAGYDESRQRPPSILVGDARTGEAFFQAKCVACHSPTGDLRGLASRIPDQRMLQQTWLMPGSGGGRGGPPPVVAPPASVTVTLPTGEKIEGKLDRVDDFVVSLTAADGTHRSFRIDGDTPRVEIHDPLQPHKELLRIYTDADIHNVTAFLAGLK